MLVFSRNISAGITVERVLLCELTGKHNDLVLLDGQDLIIAADSSRSPAHQAPNPLPPKRPFNYPPALAADGPVFYYSWQ